MSYERRGNLKKKIKKKREKEKEKRKEVGELGNQVKTNGAAGSGLKKSRVQFTRAQV